MIYYLKNRLQCLFSSSFSLPCPDSADRAAMNATKVLLLACIGVCSIPVLCDDIGVAAW